MTTKLKDGRDIEIKTPIMANVLPFIGAGIGFAIAKASNMDSTKTTISVLTGLLIGCIPKASLIMKAEEIEMSQPHTKLENKVIDAESEDITHQTNTQSSDAQNSSVLASTDADFSEEQRPVETSDIMDILDRIAESNGTALTFNTKRNHFISAIDDLTQKEIECLFDMLSMITEMSFDADPSKEQLDYMMKEIDDLKDDYGDDIFAFVNEKLNEINLVIQQPDILQAEATNAI